jgi:CHRD domain/IPT/TIG domain
MQRKLLLFALVASIGSVLFSCKKDDVIPAPPTITSFTPDNGVKGATVTITGTNFSATPANNIVMFNGIPSVATASTATSITTTVPAIATTGTISVTVGGQIATSSATFRVDLLFKATINGASEVPVNSSTATGTATLTFNATTKIFTIVVNHTVLAPLAAHIHKEAVGVSGGVVFPFTSAISPINYTSVALTAAQETDLNAGLYYVNIHSAAPYALGEIRGQLIKQ